MKSVLVERLKTHLEKAEGIKNVENYDFKPKEVPKNVEDTLKKSISVTGKHNTVWKNEEFSFTEKIMKSTFWVKRGFHGIFAKKVVS